MFWNDVLNEVVKRKANGKTAGLLNDDNEIVSVRKNRVPRPNSVVYGLGAKYGDTYFTKREAECMIWLLQGKTINGVAEVLNLSPRTVEYYIKNMKIKLGCKTKFELVDIVYASDFMKCVGNE